MSDHACWRQAGNVWSGYVWVDRININSRKKSYKQATHPITHASPVSDRLANNQRHQDHRVLCACACNLRSPCACLTLPARLLSSRPSTTDLELRPRTLLAPIWTGRSMRYSPAYAFRLSEEKRKIQDTRGPRKWSRETAYL